MRGLNGRRVVVTGGASGIGRATVIRLAEEGCLVGIFDLDEKGAALTKSMCPENGRAVTTYKVDIVDYAQVKDAVQRFESEVGPVELLANVAGWDRAMPFIDSDVELWHKIIGINLYGPLNLQHVILKGMAQRKFGRVVNVASDAGRVGSSGEAVYSACKGGVASLTKTLARELARSGVTLNVVCPGPTDTPLFHSIGNEKLAEALVRAIPMRRLGKPEDCAGMIAFLLSDDAQYMTGQTVSVSGGLTMHG
ncbi:MAG: SDR family oxidoreductase [Hyphomicrobiales bacterium]|nr:SDR family oxidoreductase [Hyphomicrobiales bacterium]